MSTAWLAPLLLVLTPSTQDLDADIVALGDLMKAREWERVLPRARDVIAALEQLSLDERPDRSSLLAYALHGQGRALASLGRPEEALAALEAGLATDPPPPWEGVSRLHSRQAFVWMDLGLPDLARAPADAAVAESLRDLEGDHPHLVVLANAYLAQGRQRLAVGLWEETCAVVDEYLRHDAEEGVLSGLDDARRQGVLSELFTLSGVAKAVLGRDDSSQLEEARAFLEEACALVPPERAFVPGARLASLEFELGEAEAAAERIALLRKQAPPSTPEDRASLALLEARLAIARGKPASEARAFLDEPFGELVARWREVDRSGGVGYLRYERAQRLLGALIDLSPPDEALEFVVEAQRLGILWRALGEPDVDAGGIRAALTDPRTGCLVIVPAGERCFVLAFDDEDFAAADAGDSVELTRLTWDLQGHLSRLPKDLLEGRRKGRSKAIDELTRRLGERLFPPRVRALLETWTRVRTVGRDGLQGLPLELLPVGDEPLGVRCAVSDLPSLPVGWALAQRRKGKKPLTEAARRRAVLVGMPRTHPDVVEKLAASRLEELPVIELKRIDASPFELVAFTGEDATPGALTRPEVRDARLVHVLAHGASELGHELQRVIVLAPDEKHPFGLLRVEETRELTLPDLVVLSVCQASRGVERVGDPGASHFGGSALAAGASSVVVTSGPLLLSVALELSSALYAELAEDVSPAEAMRRARAHLYEQGADPSAWGTTAVYGLGD